jgi:hypothetical protein
VRCLDLTAVDDPVAEPEEDVLDLAPDLRDQVQASAGVAVHRKRHVDTLLREPPVELRPLELGRALGDRRLDPLAGGVQRAPGGGVAHLAKRQRERALAAEVLHPDALDLVARRRGGDRREGRTLERLDVHGTSEASK